MQVIARERERLPHTARSGFELQQGGELGLSAVATVMDDEVPGDLLGQCGTVILLDQRQRQVDAGGNARGGPGIGVLYENPVGVDSNLWKAGLQHASVAPMRRRSTAFQQACGRKQARAGAYAGYTPRA